MNRAVVLLLVVAAVSPAVAQPDVTDARAPIEQPVSATAAEATPPATSVATPAPEVARVDAAVTPAAVMPPAFAPWPAARATLELDTVTQGRATRRAGDDLSEVRLERGEAGARIGLGKRAAAELRMEAIRSAADGGALGIDGDSTVLRIKLAQVMAMHDLGEHVRLEGAFGVVPDPWIRGLEEDYTLRPLSRTGSERYLGWPVADLSMLVRASFGPVRATASMGNGEGLQYPERNRGKTTMLVIDVVPIHTSSMRLTASGVVRDGSRGFASIRDRRPG